MSKQEYRRRKLQRQHRARMKRLLAVIFVLIIGTCGITFGSAFASAHEIPTEDPVSCKYFQSIEITKGDSLWNLADSYMSEEYASKEEYIEDIVKLNHLESTTIYDGQKLIVPYYSTDSRN